MDLRTERSLRKSSNLMINVIFDKKTRVQIFEYQKEFEYASHRWTYSTRKYQKIEWTKEQTINIQKPNVPQLQLFPAARGRQHLRAMDLLSLPTKMQHGKLISAWKIEHEKGSNDSIF